MNSELSQRVNEIIRSKTNIGILIQNYLYSGNLTPLNCRSRYLNETRLATRQLHHTQRCIFDTDKGLSLCDAECALNDNVATSVERQSSPTPCARNLEECTPEKHRRANRLW
ncbi:hypothetical protein CDAR_35501 [Caerostris darwini]|uniref:Uncharacterized protein n=1 Tax=Caerostris darwini TaxID=1538125 RepID=A0AAV4SPJ9_9ARAC|nr:hypothetical protein CDAR_35501 [Caerostris darwini]